MNGARVFEDAYSGVFREQEDFFSCLHEIMGKSSWIRQKVRNLRLVPIIAGSTLEKELRSQYTEDGMDDGIITDTRRMPALLHRDQPYGQLYRSSDLEKWKSLRYRDRQGLWAADLFESILSSRA